MRPRRSGGWCSAAASKLIMEPPTATAPMWAHRRPLEAARRDEPRPLSLPRRSRVTLRRGCAPRRPRTRETRRIKARREKWDERGEGAKVCVRASGSERGWTRASKTTSCSRKLQSCSGQIRESQRRMLPVCWRYVRKMSASACLRGGNFTAQLRLSALAWRHSCEVTNNEWVGVPTLCFTTKCEAEPPLNCPLDRPASMMREWGNIHVELRLFTWPIGYEAKMPKPLSHESQISALKVDWLLQKDPFALIFSIFSTAYFLPSFWLQMSLKLLSSGIIAYLTMAASQSSVFLCMLWIWKSQLARSLGN